MYHESNKKDGYIELFSIKPSFLCQLDFNILKLKIN